MEAEYIWPLHGIPGFYTRPFMLYPDSTVACAVATCTFISCHSSNTDEQQIPKHSSPILWRLSALISPMCNGLLHGWSKMHGNTRCRWESLRYMCARLPVAGEEVGHHHAGALPESNVGFRVIVRPTLRSTRGVRALHCPLSDALIVQTSLMKDRVTYSRSLNHA